MSTKGTSLAKGQTVVLDLDGTLVYIEDQQTTFLAVVALPEQPAGRKDERTFTPGRVGAKKISPYATGTVVTDLSPRNDDFLTNYIGWREQNGPNFVHRTPEEEAAMSVVKVEPTKSKREKKEKPAKEAKQPLCAKCSQQRGHPNHPDDHEYEGPVTAEKPAKEPKAPRAPKAGKPVEVPAGNYRWVGADSTLAMLAAVNPKYKEGNSGAVIVEAIKAGAGTPEAVHAILQGHERWSEVPLDRVQLAFKQLLGTKLLEVVA